MCRDDPLCSFLLNHEERLKRVESLVDKIYSALNQHRAAINQLQTQLEHMRRPMTSIQSVFQSALNTDVTIQTDAGGVSGFLMMVGDDFLQILESTGDTVLIRMASIVSF